jgi:large conductance mechanosensitive channel
MAFIEDFKKFAFKGNVIDLAVGVVIGAAFGKIVSSLVADLVMPLVALVLPSGDWRSHGLVLKHAADAKDDVILKYGDFLGAVLDFFVVAIALFVIVSRIVKAAEARFAGPAKPEVPTNRECPLCCETVPARAKRCKFCTSELTPLPSAG